MNPFAIKSTLTVLAFCCASGLHAQQFTVRESETTLKGPRHLSLLSPAGDYIALTYPYTDDKDPVTFSRFDAKSLSQQLSVPVAELSGQHLRAATYAGGHLFLFTSNKDGAVSRFELNDKNGTMTGAPLPLFNLDTKEEGIRESLGNISGFSFGASPDKNYYYLVAEESPKKEKSKIFQGILFDRQMNKLSTFSYTTPEKEWYSSMQPDMLLSNKGLLSIIYRYYDEATRNADAPVLFYSFLQVDTKGKTSGFPLGGLPAGHIKNFAWTIKGDDLSFTAFSDPERKAKFRNIITGTLESGQKKVGNLRTTAITDLVGQMPDFVKKAIDKKGISLGAGLVYQISFSDGSSLLVLEQGNDHSSVSVTTNSSGTATSHLNSQYSERDDLYLAKIDPSGKPVWLNMITKTQNEAGTAIEIGIVCTIDEKDNTYVFFNDNKKNTAPTDHTSSYIGGKDEFGCVTVAPDGTMKKQFIAPYEDHNFQLMPERGMTLRNNEIVFTRIHRKTSFGTQSLFNRSTYQYGVITIK